MTIGRRIGLGFAVVLLAALVIITPTVLSQIGSLIESAERRELHAIYLEVLARIAAEQRFSLALSTAVANIPAVQSAFAKGDRAALQEMMLPVFAAMKEQFAVRQFQFHTPPATSFLRVHKVEKFGDDLSSFRHTVVAANTEQRPVQGLESGVAGLGIRGVAPLHFEGRHLGSVEFGGSFGQPFLEAVKASRADIGLELALHLRGQEGFKNLAKTYAEDSPLDPSDLQSALQGPVFRHAAIGGAAKAVFAGEVSDYSGRPLAVLEIAVDRGHYEQALASARNLTLLVGAIALLLGLAGAYVVTRGITLPIRRTAAALNDIAQGEGDLTHALEVRGNDEIAQLGEGFNRFTRKIRDTVGRVGGSAIQVAAAADQLSATIDRFRQALGHQRRETDLVVTAINEMASSVQEVAQNAEAAAGAAHHADTETSGGRQVVGGTVDAIGALAEEMERASGVIAELESESRSIGTVLEVIRAIAEQTNLLALNAAIEAARAGEQGRGFAVVADEVRTLASRTHTSTQEIDGMIARLQSRAKEAVATMDRSRSLTARGVEQAQKAGAALTTITGAVGVISRMNAQIAAAAEEQRAVAEEINRNVHAIDRESEKNLEASEEATAAGRELARLAGDLKALVGQFKY